MTLMACVVLAIPAFGQSLPAPDLRQMIQAFKADPRGPYKTINWFCPDGTTRPAQSPCGQPGGIQHGVLKDTVERLRDQSGLYLGQILAGTPYEAFWDAANQSLRAKQYQMEQFLRMLDDGWIFRRAQFYRGAFQAEDEEAWGIKFLTWLLAQDSVLSDHFFLVRQMVQDIPHAAQDRTLRRIRALAKSIADVLPLFADLRVKLHGQPDARDLERVKFFRIKHRDQLTPDVAGKFQELEQALTSAYEDSGSTKLASYVRRLPTHSPLVGPLNRLLSIPNTADVSTRSGAIADLLWQVRITMPATPSSQIRLALMDLSMTLEGMLFRRIGTWYPRTVGELFDKAYVLARVAAGSGFLELWEWQTVEATLQPPTPDMRLSLEQFRNRVETIRRVVAWGGGMVHTVYEPVVRLFAGFEPLAAGFIDDRIRGSILLPFGEAAGQLSELVARYTGLSNRVLDLSEASQIRGLNAGFARGELVVLADAPEGADFASDKVYVLSRAPADLKPVAGIATVSEGNLVSHVQLLARNLGVPNAVLTPQLFRALMPFSGTAVFYAVSPQGTVLIKRADEMTPEERDLVETRRRSEDVITVRTDKLDLSYVTLTSLHTIRAVDSGRICGPKAANLGQLRVLFPNRVAPGLVVPFGVFRQHLEQPMSGTSGSYWNFLQATFGPDRREPVILQRLAQLRQAIARMPLRRDFVEALQQGFRDVFEKPLGQVPVFVRSDTNMEDLKDFTGAGLNLTVPNVLPESDILQAIREVWASPFTERSYRWRQKYLNNPEHVYPSLVLLRSVNVEKSGVMITTGVPSSRPEDITVAFNRGTGGAVEGQAAESYLLNAEGADILLSPSRTLLAAVLSPSGGVQKQPVSLNTPILTPGERAQLRQLAAELRQRLPGTPGIESSGPFDVELGFMAGRLWLFQVRPFVENKRARASTYLQSLDTAAPHRLQLPMTTALGAPSP